MPSARPSLPRYLREIQTEVEGCARALGLEFFPVIFEILTYEEMNMVAAYGGFPTRYPHWRFGMEYQRFSKGYAYGLHRIYEMVINNNPCYAYLLEGNSTLEHKIVMAHVLAHCDFFKRNRWFAPTSRKMMDEMANHATQIARAIDRYGQDQVERFLDACLSVENLIDPSFPFQPSARRAEAEPEEPAAKEVPRLPAKPYMESFINPPEYLERQRVRGEEDRARSKRFPEEPSRDVMLFVLDNAPLERWEQNVLSIVRDEAYYFFPQGQTKIMNEGWATYWHSEIMTKKALKASEVIDYADHASMVLATAGGRLNPYKLGLEMFRDIEERWNTGRFGKEWEDCDDMDRRRTWFRPTGLGREKIFQVRTVYNDVTFLDEFLTLEFCVEHDLFSFGYNAKRKRWEVLSREFADVKRALLQQITNSGNPEIHVADGNFENRGELLLEHRHDGLDLDQRWADETLGNLALLWRRPVHVLTQREGANVRISHDGKEARTTGA
ncbi:MAG: SpoVR family protein [Myxococcota bacterium]|nr:SpoVR family protein [Myxococcota bacterium]